MVPRSTLADLEGDRFVAGRAANGEPGDPRADEDQRHRGLDPAEATARHLVSSSYPSRWRPETTSNQARQTYARGRLALISTIWVRGVRRCDRGKPPLDATASRHSPQTSPDRGKRRQCHPAAPHAEPHGYGLYTPLAPVAFELRIAGTACSVRGRRERAQLLSVADAAAYMSRAPHLMRPPGFSSVAHAYAVTKEESMTVLKLLADAFHEGGWGMWPILFLLMLTIAIIIERAVLPAQSGHRQGEAAGPAALADLRRQHPGRHQGLLGQLHPGDPHPPGGPDAGQPLGRRDRGGHGRGQPARAAAASRSAPATWPCWATWRPWPVCSAPSAV